MLETIIIVMILTILAVASYTDLKTREVPDILSYGLIFSVLGVRIIFSFESGWMVLLSGVIGLVAGYIVAALFYYTHQWGGGDSKLMMGVGAAIGVTLPITQHSFNLLIFLFLLLFAGAIYGLIWMGNLAFKHRDKFGWKFKDRIKRAGRMHLSTGIASALLVVPSISMPTLWPLVFFPLGLFYIFMFVTTIEDHFFVKWIKPGKVTEGDWLAEEIIVDGKIKVSNKTVDKKDLNVIRNLYQKNKIKSVRIREGIPFIPSFLIAYIILLVWEKVYAIVL